MGFEFKKANKAKSKLRCAVFGPSGAGKTMSALRMAKGMGGRVALIDTERSSASLYADRYEFDALDLPNHDINTYVHAIEAASKGGYDILIIDSLSHGWQELLSEIDRIAKTKYRGNSWSAWSEGTPKQKKLVDALLSFDGHVIVTMRSKTEWTTTTNDRGKSQPSRVGLTPEQGKGIEYEFSLLLEINTEHQAICIKDRTGKFQDKVIEKPGEEFGQELVAWLNEGVDAPKPVAPEPPQETPTPEEPQTPGDSLRDAIGITSEGAETIGPELWESIQKNLDAAHTNEDNLRAAMKNSKYADVVDAPPETWPRETVPAIERWIDRVIENNKEKAS